LALGALRLLFLALLGEERNLLLLGHAGEQLFPLLLRPPSGPGRSARAADHRLTTVVRGLVLIGQRAKHAYRVARLHLRPERYALAELHLGDGRLFALHGRLWLLHGRLLVVRVLILWVRGHLHSPFDPLRGVVATLAKLPVASCVGVEPT